MLGFSTPPRNPTSWLLPGQGLPYRRRLLPVRRKKRAAPISETSPRGERRPPRNQLLSKIKELVFIPARAVKSKRSAERLRSGLLLGLCSSRLTSPLLLTRFPADVFQFPRGTDVALPGGKSFSRDARYPLVDQNRARWWQSRKAHRPASEVDRPEVIAINDRGDLIACVHQRLRTFNCAARSSAARGDVVY